MCIKIDTHISIYMLGVGTCVLFVVFACAMSQHAISGNDMLFQFCVVTTKAHNTSGNVICLWFCMCLWV